ncbi:hypothetical protein JOF56_007604 [Kibdelosporangium banguiense]|uniref:TIR domain-containing protein n=1 Tax=Kibdelosporangium banguiense TaxID=1365924 RepID=A0ABS4TT86_9PSEU|nr:toll/interleukin-1 receptor domain-containing protein [Kibdelosporangium banguiense]MBP2327219.1 hypothetical protein [Kibdelosporangium banguiense]
MADETSKFYEVFISFSGTELPRVRMIENRLRDLGISVFVDRTENRPADRVTPNIEQALARSRMCLVYYAERYSRRHACQFELAQAFVADASEGGRTRLLVVNPEKGKDHIHPVELRDQIYVRDDDESPAAIDGVVSAVQERLAGLTGTFQDIDFQRLPMSYFRHPGVEPRVRRYSAIWALHSALNRQQHRMTQPPSNNTAVLFGLAGSGKSSLVDDYRLHFESAYHTVVHLDLHNETERVLEIHTAQTSTVATTGTVLWIVDNVSPDLDESVVEQLIPRHRDAHTVLITQQRAFDGLGEPVPVSRMTEDEGAALFTLCHTPAADEADLVRSLVNRVHGHPMTIAQLGLAAAERQGLDSLMEHVGRVLDGTSGTMDQIAGIFADRLSRVRDEDQLALLRLSAVCTAEPLPVRFVRDTLRRLGMSTQRVMDGLFSLGKALLATRTGEWWTVHPVVWQAVRRHLPDPDADIRVATAAAETLLGYDDHADASTLLHAQRLVENDKLPSAVISGLLRHIAFRLKDIGRPGLAARYFDRLLATGATDIQLAAARSHFDAGEYAESARLAREVHGDQEWDAAVILASSLDSLGLLEEAETHWTRVATPAVLSTRPTGNDLEARLLWIRGRSLRGSLREHKDFLTGLLNRRHDLPVHMVNAALLELADIQMQTDEQIEARENAQKVVDHYTGLGQLYRPQAVEAQFVLAGANLLIHFLEFKPDATRWPEAERTYRALADDLEPQLGARNIQVLTIRVAVGQTLISQGKAADARSYASELLAILRGRLADTHPLVLRCCYVLGMAHAQLTEFGPAVTCLEEAHTGQLAAFGVYHHETLRTQYELGVLLKITKDKTRANNLLDGVRRAAPKVTGRVNDLYGQATVATTLARYVPSRVLRWAHWLNHKDKQ